MIDTGKLLGALMQGGLNQVGGRRLEHALGGGGLEQMTGMLGGLLGGGQGGGGLGGLLGGGQGGLGGLLGAATGGSSSTGGQDGGLGGLLGGLVSGGQSSSGGGAMAVLGMLAMNVLNNRGQHPAPSSSNPLLAGLRPPESQEEERQVQDIALLTLKAMVNAAKADGRIDAQELERIVGKLQEDGVEPEEQAFIRSELAAPMDTDGLAAAAHDPQVALQLYTASLLAIEVDSDAERRYLADLAAKLRLDPSLTQQVHTLLGVA